jgi:hypothetical protein
MKTTSEDQKCSRVLILLLVALCTAWNLFANVRTAAAGETDMCMQEAYNVYDKQKLNCTANDVSIVIYQTTGQPLVCETGAQITAPLQAQLVATANERYDIGMYIALDGGNALTGTCWRDWLLPPLTTTKTPAGQPRYYPFFDGEETEDPHDTCGDLEQGIYSYRDLGNLTFVCNDSNNDGIADIGACASWDNLKSNGTTKNPSCTTLEQTLPNTPSKCRCEATPIANIYAGGKIIVRKITDPAGDPTEFDFTLKGGPDVVDKSFKLADGQTSETYLLRAGTYQVTELAENGWALSGLACTVTGTNGSSVTYADAAASITLKAKDTVTCDYANIRTAKDLTVTKTATPAFDRLYKWQIDKSVDDTRIEIAEGGSATFNYNVKVTPDGYVDSNWNVSGQITVTNPNDFAISGATVSDEVSNGGTCTVTGGSNMTIPANDSVVLDYSCTYAAAPTVAAGNNTATAVWDKAAYFTPNGSATGTAAVNFAAPAAEINKTITVVDDKTMGIPVTLGTSDYLAGPFVFTYQLSTQGVAGTCTDYTNTAVIEETKQSDSQAVTVCVGKDLTVAKTATPTFIRTWDWTITKETDASYDLFAGASATHGYKVSVTPNPIDSNWQVDGTITVTNSNDWQDITLASLADAVDNGGICTVTAGPYVVPKSGSLAVSYSCTYATITANTGTNTATASWDKAAYFTPASAASGTAGFAFEKPTTENNPVITVDDDNLTGESWSADRAAAEWTYNKDFTCSAQQADYTDGKYSYSHTNTATINGISGKSDSAKVDINCYAPELNKTAETYFNRKWDWTITKDFDGSYEVFAGGTVTHDYKVTVTPNATDNGWGVRGTIAVLNHHPTEAMVLTNISDLAGGINGIVTCPELTVPAAGSLTCTYDTGPQTSPNVNPFGTTNTATAVFAAANWTGTAVIAFNSMPTSEENPVITVDDDNLTGESWSADRAAAEWTYTRDFACSAQQADYTDGKYSYSHTNTATINGISGKSDSAKVDVLCYAPVLSKTAAGSYDERHDWTVKKAVSPASQNGFAGDTLPFTWTIDVTETSGDENFAVTGTITVQNPAPMAMTVALSDRLNGTTATIGACTGGRFASGSLTVPAGGTAICSYSAAPTDHTATLNTATATLNQTTFTASAPITWTANILRAEAILTDLQGPLSETITGSGTWTVNDSFTCATDKTRYANDYSYTETLSNTAVITSGGSEQARSSASTTIACYTPEISKTAAGTYTERHEWDVEKTVNTPEQSAFAGDTVAYEWKVTVNEAVVEEGFAAAGTITLVNHNPEDALTVALSDQINGTPVTITTCTGDADLTDGLTVAAGATAVCDYAVKLPGVTTLGQAPTSNTATAVLNGIAYTAAAPIAWSANVIDASVTLDDDQNPTFPITITEGGTWSYAEQHSCSTDKNSYDGLSHKYTYTTTNTAMLMTLTGTSESSTAATSINCYVPAISKSATGSFDEIHDWAISKTVDTASQSAFAGEHKNFVWTVQVDETTHDENYDVTGGITVVNPNPEDALTVALSDILSDGTIATITHCTGGTWGDPNLTIPAGGTAVCGFLASPSEKAPANTVTAVLNGIPFPASADILWTGTAINATVTIDDDQKPDWPVTVSDDTTFTYTDPQGYTCSTDPGAYSNGSYYYKEANTARLTFTTGSSSGNNSDTATADTEVICYAPVVTKSAAGTYTERHDWTVEKTVDKEMQNAFAGDRVNYEWTVTVAETVTEEGFVASGTISVKNPRPDDGNMTVRLHDVLSDGFVATIGGCTGGIWNGTTQTVTVPSGITAVCSYTATLGYADDVNAPTLNTVTAELLAGASHLITTASDPIEWASSIVRASATLADGQNPAFPITITEGGTWKYTQSYTCSTSRSNYDDTFMYRFGESNIATVSSEGSELDRAETSTAVGCYWPQIDLVKTGDDLSKISDQVHYDFTLSNNTPTAAGLRALNCTISDARIGFSKSVTLASGAKNETLDVAFTIPSGAADPFVNTAQAICKPAGSAFAVTTDDSWSTNLFQPAITIDKSGPAQAYPGNTIKYTFTITNISSIDSPALVLDSISDDKLGNLMTVASLAGCGTLAPGSTCSFTADKTFAVEFNAPYEVKNTVTVHYHPAGFPNDIQDDDDHTVIVMPPILVTSSALCTFDVDPALAGRQFRRIFTQDPQQMPNYKLNATNPGQFFYNLAVTGAPGEQVDITLDIPWAFVTQGNMPIHVYDGVSLSPQNGQVCFIPGNETQAIGQYVVLADYPAGYTDPQTTVPVKFTITIPSTGFAYVNQHLDDGLKGPQVILNSSGIPQRYGKDGNSNALNPANLTEILIPNLFTHTFSVAADGTPLGSDSVQNLNEFKKNPGTGGIIMRQQTLDPVAGIRVRLLSPSNTVVGSAVTDKDGWYMIPYKHTGKLALYRLQVDVNGNGIWNDSGDLFLNVSLKANAYTEVNVQIP